MSSIYDNVGSVKPASKSIYDSVGGATAPAPVQKGIIPTAITAVKNFIMPPAPSTPVSLYDQVKPPAPLNPLQSAVGAAIGGWNQAASMSAPKDFGTLGAGSPKLATSFFKSLGEQYDAALQAAGSAEHDFVDKPNMATGAAAVGQVGLQTLNAVFAPFSAALTSLSSVPVIGNAADLVNKFFAAVGSGASEVAQNDFIQNLPISQQSKDTLKPVVGGLAALAAQIALGKGGGDAVTALADKAKTLVSTVHTDLGAQVHIMEKSPENTGHTIAPQARAPMTHEEYARSMGYEPYTPTDQLPVIQMGAGKRGTFALPSAEPLPTIQVEGAPESVGAEGAAPETTLTEQLRSAYRDVGHGLLSHEIPETGVPTEADVNGEKFADFGEPATSAVDAAATRVKYQQETVDSAPKAQRALDYIKTQLQLSEPGYRYGVSYGSDAKSYGVPSTFPQWLPEELRSSGLFEKVFGPNFEKLSVEKLEYPPAKNVKQRALFDEVLAKVDRMAGVDTSALRAIIMSNESRRNTEASRDGSGRDAGSKGANGVRNSAFRYEPIEQPTFESVRSVPRETPVRTTQRIEPIKGTGKRKVRGVSQSLEAATMAKGLSDGFGALPEFRGADFNKIASDISEHIKSDPADALKIALGEKAASKGSIPEMYLNLVSKLALSEGDFATADMLAKQSKLTEAGTTMGQRLAALGYKKSAVDYNDAIREVQNAREAALKTKNIDLPRAKSADASAFKNEVKAARSPRPKWADFAKEIACGY